MLDKVTSIKDKLFTKSESLTELYNTALLEPNQSIPEGIYTCRKFHWIGLWKQKMVQCTTIVNSCFPRKDSEIKTVIEEARKLTEPQVSKQRKQYASDFIG